MDRFVDLPLTQGQLLLWTGQEMNPGDPLYNIPHTFEIGGHIDVVHFQVAFQALIKQSDALRTIFINQGGLPVQRVYDTFPYELECIQVGSQEEVENWIEENQKLPFDISQRNFESVLFQLPNNKSIWYLLLHHLISDAWSVSVLSQKMGELYHLSLEGNLAKASPLPLYADYLSFEQSARFNKENEASRLFWEQRAGELPVPPRLYGEKGSPSESRSERVVIHLGKERSDKLKALTGEKELRAWTENMSLFNMFSTALFVYLYRVSGQRNIAIGSPAHNRHTPTFKQTPGAFIELFPLVAEMEEDESFQDVFRRIAVQSNEFLRHAKPGASSSRLSRQFNVVLNFIHTKFGNFGEIPMKGEWLHPGHCDPGHHLRLQVHDLNDTGDIQLNFDLNVSVFSPEMREEVPKHFLKVLDTFIEDREQKIDGFPLIEQPILLDTHSLNGQALRKDQSVLELFLQQVAQDPQEIALEQGGRTMTYVELDKRANQLAKALTSNGIQKGDRIGIHLTRSMDFMVSLLGAWKAGATYIPLPSDTPVGRLKFILEDAGAKILVSEIQLSSQLESLSIPLVLVEELKGRPSPQVFALPNGEDLAYIMYTSGSTGTPKGVMINHRALSNYVHWASKTYSQEERFVFPLFSKIGFDLTVTSQFLPLVSGGKVLIYPESPGAADLSILQVIADNQVNTLKLTPSHLALLKDQDLQDSLVETLIVGGEDFPTSLAKEISENMGSLKRIFNEYGPTEATVGCVVHSFHSDTDTQSSVPIGLPIDGMEVFVLDTQLQPVPQGVPGELYLAGKSLSDGYVNQPSLTQKSFVTLAFPAGLRAYASGDLVRINRKGQLEYLGRVDKQVKIGGVRIEPGEIESLLGQHPAIHTAIVEVQQNQIQHLQGDLQYCTSCGLPSNYPDASYDEEGVCMLCNSFDSYQRQAEQYFRGREELRALFDEIKSQKQGEYDCLMLLSGGKDSSYALARLVELDLKVLAFTLDNGYISEQAKANISRIVNALGVDHIFGETAAMNAIFVDSLKRHSNVCNGCFKTIYTLSTKIALEKRIPYIVTGLSRGQFFETRLTEELFREEEINVSKIDDTILEARKAYHKVNDAVCQLLDVSMFKDDSVFEQVKFLDFYRYTDVSLEEMMAYLEEKLPWKRPTDTGRSTNCLINQVGIYIHKKEQGYNNYAFPYSWDVRIGHKTRDEALHEINEPIDEREVRKILEEIGYTEVLEKFNAQKSLTAFYTAGSPVTPEELQAYLSEHLPAAMIPTRFVELPEIPLTANGKVDRELLRSWGQENGKGNIEDATPPETEIEEIVAPIWEEILKLDRIGTHQDFIALGGTSLSAIRIMARINESLNLDLPLVSIFEQSTISTLSAHIEERIFEIMDVE